MIYLLYIILITVLVSCYLIDNREFLSPSIVFCLSFVFSTTWAVIYSAQWELGLHFNTFLVILLGVLSFVAGAFMQKRFYHLSHRKSATIGTPIQIKISNIKMVIVIIIELIIIVLSIKGIKDVTGFQNLSAAINCFDQRNKFSQHPLSLPRYLSFPRTALIAYGYWIGYVIVSNYFAKKKMSILQIISFILAIIPHLLSGGRGGAVNVLLAFVLLFGFFSVKKKRFYNYHIKTKYVVIGLIAAIIVISSFQRVGVLLGRNIVTTGMDLIAGYCGADVKNLDLFLQESVQKSDIWGSQTFINIYRWIGPKIGMDGYYYQLYLPFRSVNGHSLGNVGSAFYSYYYDFGMSGVIILSLIMGLISQYIYEKCKKAKYEKFPNIYILTYSYIYPTLFFSFFSNKFYELCLTPAFFEYVLCWFIFSKVLCAKLVSVHRLAGNKKAILKY